MRKKKWRRCVQRCAFKDISRTVAPIHTKGLKVRPKGTNLKQDEEGINRHKFCVHRMSPQSTIYLKVLDVRWALKLHWRWPNQHIGVGNFVPSTLSSLIVESFWSLSPITHWCGGVWL